MSPARATIVLGTAIDAVALADVLERAAAFIAADVPGQIITANVDQVVGNRRAPERQALYRRAALTVADGVPLLWAARFLGAPLPGRVNGTELMERLCAEAARNGRSVFLLGGHPGAAAAAAGVLGRRFPGLRLAGDLCPAPGFESRPLEMAALLALLRARRPDILFVSLGYPKGVSWIDAHQAALGIPLAVEVGMSFRYIAGQMRRAPRWLQELGLEWFWRLAHEPRRLWKRYLVRDMPFFCFLARQRFSRRQAGVGKAGVPPGPG
jgi:N-acetylglucosaminyldiphosphoundecaprenol N-acetyl-beta-D-mannosaminyltransferase